MNRLETEQEANVPTTWFTSQLDKNGHCRMVYKDDESGGQEEAVLTMQGFLMKKDLPPLTTMPR